MSTIPIANAGTTCTCCPEYRVLLKQLTAIASSQKRHVLALFADREELETLGAAAIDLLRKTSG